MRALLVPVAFATMLAAAPIAFAATQTASGAIKSFDLKAQTLTLADGTTYTLPAHFKDPGLKVGEKVKISWDMQNGKYEASKVTVVK